MLEPHPQCVGNYILGRTLGQGTTGKVKLAEKQGEPNKSYAVKIIKRESFNVKPDLQRKIYREIALMRLLDHPHLLKLVDVLESSRHLYIVSEYASGGELFDFLVTRKRLDPPLAFKFFREIIYGLEYLHEHAICHRDLKPENILLDSSNHIKIADFGFARWMPSNIAETSCGSPHYAAPEVVKGMRYDGRAADVWSCGVILYALLVGRLPFDDQSIRGLLAKVKAGQYPAPNVDAPIHDLISKILTVDPDSRITIAGIKNHPAFRMFLPESYTPPRPLPIPYLSQPVDTARVPKEVISSLRNLGYKSDEEVISELTSNSHTMAKVFFEMIETKNRKDSLEWPVSAQGTAEPVPADAFLMSPEMAPMNLVGNREDFYRRKRGSSSSSSMEVQSFVVRNYWPDFQQELGTEQEPQEYLRIPFPPEQIFEGIETLLTNDGYEWIHPDDMHIFSRGKAMNGAFFFELTYADEVNNNLSLSVSGISSEDYEAMINDVNEIISRLVEKQSA